MRKYFSCILISLSILVGCTTYRLRTTRRLDSRTFLEYYNVNPFGVDEVFVTDSVNFRLCIAKYDVDHERIYCEANGDTIKVVKLKDNGPSQKRTRLDSAILSRDSLVRHKIRSSKPVLDFK